MIAALADSMEELSKATMSYCGEETRYGRCAEDVQDVPSYLSGGAPERPMSPTRIGGIWLDC